MGGVFIEPHVVHPGIALPETRVGVRPARQVRSFVRSTRATTRFESNVWVVGGGDLASALDEVTLTVPPVSLESGERVLRRRVESNHLTPADVTRRGQLVELTYTVLDDGSGP